MGGIQAEQATRVDVQAREVAIGTRKFKLAASDRSWRTKDPVSGQTYWFRPVERPFGEGWWYVGEPAEARYLCCLWCSACAEEGVDPRPHRIGTTSGTFDRRQR